MKPILKRLLFIVAYYLWVDALFYWLNRKAKRIVVFHNVLSDDLFSRVPAGTSCCSLSEFRSIITELEKRFAFSTNVFDAKTMTITFDDGYRNQYTTAFKYLESRGIPAILFYSSGTQGGLLIDKMLFWHACVPRSFLHKDSVPDFWPRYLQDGRTLGQNSYDWLDSIYPFDKVFETIDSDVMLERLGTISYEERDEMRRAGWVIGWHTKSHYPLAALSGGDLNDELMPPNEFRGGYLAYPYGTDQAVSNEAIQMAESLGFKAAFAYTNASERSTSRFFLPRMNTLGNDKYELHAEMSGLRYFMSYRRLLPRIATGGKNEECDS